MASHVNQAVAISSPLSSVAWDLWLIRYSHQVLVKPTFESINSTASDVSHFSRKNVEELLAMYG